MVIIDDGAADGVRRCFVVVLLPTSGTRVVAGCIRERAPSVAIRQKVDLLMGEVFDDAEIALQGGYGRCLGFEEKSQPFVLDQCVEQALLRLVPGVFETPAATGGFLQLPIEIDDTAVLERLFVTYHRLQSLNFPFQPPPLLVRFGWWLRGGGVRIGAFRLGLLRWLLCAVAVAFTAVVRRGHKFGLLATFTITGWLMISILSLR